MSNQGESTGRGAWTEPGTYEITHVSEDMGSFKAPTLRNIAVTAPYMHDGSIASLEDVVEHYASGGRTIDEGPYAGVGANSPAKGNNMRGFTLPPEDKRDIVEFLKALTDHEFLSNPRFSDPFKPVSCPGDCDLDRTVAVNELVSSVNISLGASALGQCIVSDPSGNGDVTESRRVWRLDRFDAQIGSGVIHDGHFFTISQQGVASCYNLDSGERVWQRRLAGSGGRNDSWSSMLLADGRIYVPNQAGDVFVLRAAPEFELLATNSVGESTNASLAASAGELFLRTDRGLWCFANQD